MKWSFCKPQDYDTYDLLDVMILNRPRGPLMPPGPCRITEGQAEALIAEHAIRELAAFRM